ncbi:MAG: hypothetical protein VCD00_13805 [Candidatus Hydrogenedentota bacterium]
MLISATILTALIGFGCLAGGIAVASGKAAQWPDIVVSESTLKRIGVGLFIVSALQFVAVATVVLDYDVAILIMLASTAIFQAAGFSGNKVLFGDYRPKHTGTNSVIVAIIWGLLLFA